MNIEQQKLAMFIFIHFMPVSLHSHVRNKSPLLNRDSLLTGPIVCDLQVLVGLYKYCNCHVLHLSLQGLITTTS